MCFCERRGGRRNNTCVFVKDAERIKRITLVLISFLNQSLSQEHYVFCVFSSVFHKNTCKSASSKASLARAHRESIVLCLAKIMYIWGTAKYRTNIQARDVCAYIEALSVRSVVNMYWPGRQKARANTLAHYNQLVCWSDTAVQKKVLLFAMTFLPLLPSGIMLMSDCSSTRTLQTKKNLASTLYSRGRGGRSNRAVGLRPVV